MEISRIRNLNTDVLAYMGDAVYEQIIRERLIRSSGLNAHHLHRKATGYVRAQAQAKAIKAMMGDLTEDEQVIVRRARNHKFKTKAKNADPMTYKWATAFEALIGYLYLAGDQARVEWAAGFAAAVVENRGVQNVKEEKNREKGQK